MQTTSENDNLAVGEWLPLDCLGSKELGHFNVVSVSKVVCTQCQKSSAPAGYRHQRPVRVAPA
jgi:hypothetical protein